MSRFLLVDDNRALAENLAEIIEDQGHQVAVASSGAAALEALRQGRFDALLTDMRMPAMDGAQLVHELRKFDPGLPAIVITAYSGDEDLRTARREGLLAVLAKPVPIDRLLQLLAVARRDGMVALVEDDAALSDNLSEALAERGFTTVNAATVVETDRLGEVKPFVGLVDLRVPGGPDGEAMRHLAVRFPRLPQIVISAHLGDTAPPAVAVFAKPFDTGALCERVEALYRERQR